MSEIFPGKKHTPISFDAKGMRDVFWCHRSNEPVIMMAAPNMPLRPQCPDCGTDWPDVAHIEEEGYHWFLFHINRPLWREDEEWRSVWGE